MSQLKNDVEIYIKHDRSLIGGRNLYNKMPNKSLAFQNSIARFTNTSANVAKVCYALCKLAGIAERNYKILMQKPVVAIQDIEVNTEEDAQVAFVSPLTDQLLAFDRENADYQESKKLVKALNLASPTQTKKDIYDTLEAAKAEAVKKK